MSWCLVFATPGNNFYCYRFFQEKKHHYWLRFNKNILFRFTQFCTFNYVTSCASSCGLIGTLIRNHQGRFVINVWVFVWIFFFFNVLIFFYFEKSPDKRDNSHCDKLLDLRNFPGFFNLTLLGAKS